jgi:hypothetical protein
LVHQDDHQPIRTADLERMAQLWNIARVRATSEDEEGPAGVIDN